MQMTKALVQSLKLQRRNEKIKKEKENGNKNVLLVVYLIVRHSHLHGFRGGNLPGRSSQGERKIIIS